MNSGQVSSDVESYESMNTEGSIQNIEKCDINKDRRCNTHNCGTRTIKISTKKWALNKKTGLYGNKSVKVTKLICISKNGGSDSPRISTPTRSRAAVNNLVGRAVNLFNDLESEKILKSESMERR